MAAHQKKLPFAETAVDPEWRQSNSPQSSKPQTGETMSAYLISQIRVTNEDAFQEYRQASIPVAESYGAKYLARSDDVEALDGAHDGRRVVIIEFPDMETLRAFWNSPEYQAARQLRLDAAEIDIWALPGMG